MKIYGLLKLQLSSFIGLVVGLAVKPENPIYPFAPTAVDMERISSTEIKIIVVLAISVAVASLIGRRILNETYKSTLFVCFLSGGLCFAFSALRFGQPYLPELHLILGYIICVAIIIACSYLCSKIWRKASY